MPKPSSHPSSILHPPSNQPPDQLTRAAAIARRRMLAAAPGSQFRAALIVTMFEYLLNTPVRIPTETTIDVRV